MTNGHSPHERRLLTDTHRKNALSDELRRLVRNMERWQFGLKKKRSRRWQTQYRHAIRRAAEQVAELQGELLARAEDLQARIQEELKVSKTEVEQYQQQFKKEVEELRAAEHQVIEARKALQKAESDPIPEAAEETEEIARAKVLTDLRAGYRRAQRRARFEARDVVEVEEDLDSEAKDEIVLKRELERIVAEIEALRP